MAKSNNSEEKSVKKDKVSGAQAERTGKKVSSKKRGEKGKVASFFSRMGKGIKETALELKRVTWPTLPAALKATGVVIAIVAVFLVIVTLINFGLLEALEWLTRLGS